MFTRRRAGLVGVMAVVVGLAAAPVATSFGAESGLVVYGNPPAAQFKPVADAFAKAHPGIKIAYSDQEDNVSFSKYRAESAQHARTADIIIASSPRNWYNNRSIALNWTPQGLDQFPSFVRQYPGVFVLSPDPAVSVYSKAKLPGNRIPRSFRDLEDWTKKYPSLFAHKLATFTVDNQFGYSAFWGLVHTHGWFGINTLGPHSKAQPDTTAIVKQILSGASTYGYFASGLVRGALSSGSLSKIAGWTYMKDFTPLIPRGIAVTKSARSPGQAKTFVTWMYSAAGQRTMCAAGFTAFRNGVSCSNSLASVQRAVGAKNTFLVPFTPAVAHDYDGFVKRWHTAFH